MSGVQKIKWSVWGAGDGVRRPRYQVTCGRLYSRVTVTVGLGRDTGLRLLSTHICKTMHIDAKFFVVYRVYNILYLVCFAKQDEN